ncbi:MAG: hypothetical protein LBC68_02070 [Prevotellaceae bacterium]|nr:hypothetical protein [Prevotellaceae bacterium]
MKRILTENGYYEGGIYYFYVKNHLGSNVMTVNRSGSIVQGNHYYPYGLTMGGISTNPGVQAYKYTGKELDMDHGLMLYDYGARLHDPAVGRFLTMDPMAEKYYSVSPYAYCGNNPINRIDPTGMDYYVLTDEGRMVLALRNDDETDKLFAVKKSKEGNEYTDIKNTIEVNDKRLLPQLAGGKDFATAETSNSFDAFGVFKFAADNSNPEWSLKGYGTEGRSTGFLLSTSYDKESVSSGNGNYDPFNMLFSLHSHPADSDNLGPSGSLTRAPGSNSYYPGNLGGDLYTMMGIMNSASQMRRRIIGR